MFFFQSNYLRKNFLHLHNSYNLNIIDEQVNKIKEIIMEARPVGPPQLPAQVVEFLTWGAGVYQQLNTSEYFPGTAAADRVMRDALSSGMGEFLRTALYESPMRQRDELDGISKFVFSRVEYVEAWFASSALFTANLFMTICAVVNYVARTALIKAEMTGSSVEEREGDQNRAKEILMTQLAKLASSKLAAVGSFGGVLLGSKMDSFVKDSLAKAANNDRYLPAVAAMLNALNHTAEPNEVYKHWLNGVYDY